MIYIKRQTSKGKNKTVELTEDTKFYAQCADCGKEVEATEEIIDNFSEYIYGSCRIICDSCAAKRRSAENAK